MNRRAGGSSMLVLDEHRLASTKWADSPFASDAVARPWWDGGADDAPGPADPVLTGPASTRRGRQMTEQSPSQSRSARGQGTSGTAVGFIMFAAIMMIMVGVFQALQGLIAIFENEFYVATRNYIFRFDATTWGWIHLLVGLLVAFAGWGLLSGKTWARVVALTSGRAERHRQLPVRPLLPVLGAAPHHPGHLCHLGDHRPRRRAAGPGLTEARDGRQAFPG
jgi:hypothetical protein